MGERDNSYPQGFIPETGLTVLFQPDEPTMDILFIHGFTGHPVRTWASKRRAPGYHDNNPVPDNSLEPPSKIRKLNPFSKSRQPNPVTNTCYWPRDLIPETVPHARVLTYGYDTHIKYRLGAPIDRSTVYEIAWDLLVALESDRRSDPSRSIMFVVHSLGGIVVKEMLRRSRGCRLGQAHLRGIYESAIGIIFFGTPHLGADPRGILQHIAEKVLRAGGLSVNDKIVKDLLPSSERLKELRDEFGLMAQEQNWIVHSFQEQYGVQALGGQKVVDDASSFLNVPAVEIVEHIGQNHMEMCRFSGMHDVEYRKVSSALSRISAATMKCSKPGKQRGSCLSQEQKKALLDSLEFSQIDSRHMTIRKEHAQTCRWFLEKPEYLDWLDPHKLGGHHGFLWIKGKPGSGKSTLMKFILGHARRKMKDKTILYFFFHARGVKLEKSTVGMYRSLLLQLLEQHPALQDALEREDLPRFNGENHPWSVESLKDLFAHVVDNLRNIGKPSVLVFIDALDECDENQIRDMITFFEHMCNVSQKNDIPLRICFASRLYPHISFSRSLHLVLHGQEGHNEDISKYIVSTLKISHAKTASQIRDQLLEKASGIFMWVVIVIDILNKENDEGRRGPQLLAKLKQIPADLHGLFRDILQRDDRNKAEHLLCIQWILFAQQPLTPEQLYLAIVSGTEPEAISMWDASETGVDTIERSILNSSKGLAEVMKTKARTVQFIHESVRDFLLKENGLRDVWPDLSTDIQAASHNRLKTCCLAYARMAATDLKLENPLPKASSDQGKSLRQSTSASFPLLEYAVQNLLRHADTAERGGISQVEFTQKFPIVTWIELNNLLEKYDARRYTSDATLLYILAEKNMSHLVNIHPSKLACFEENNERYGSPIFAALATGSHETVLTFLDSFSEFQPYPLHIHNLYVQSTEASQKKKPFTRAFSFQKEKRTFRYLSEYGNEALMLCYVLAAKAINAAIEVGPRGYNKHETLLRMAAEEGHTSVVQLLLEMGADVEPATCQDKHLTDEALTRAVRKGHTATVRALLDHGADVEFSGSSNGDLPLAMAVASGHNDTIQLLLDRGANIESKNDVQRTALCIAARLGKRSTVELLLDKGAEIESREEYGQTPLAIAASKGHRPIVQLLLDRGADVDSRDSMGRTPLLSAAASPGGFCIRALLNNGADIQAKDNWGQTALSLAEQTSPRWSNYEDIICMLKSNEADS